MFSQTLKKMDEMPHKTLLVVAACLVILCQLVAMALVVDGQVKRVEARDSALSSQRLAVVRCNEAGLIAMRQSCIQQAMAAWSAAGQPESSSQGQAAANPEAIGRGDAPAGKAPGLVAVSYTGR